MDSPAAFGGVIELNSADTCRLSLFKGLGGTRVKKQIGKLFQPINLRSLPLIYTAHHTFPKCNYHFPSPDDMIIKFFNARSAFGGEID